MDNDADLAGIRRRPRSTIMPGRRPTDLHALIQAGEADDNSYLEMSTDSETSMMRNRSASGRDFPDIDFEEEENEETPIPDSNNEDHSVNDQEEVDVPREEDLMPPPKKLKSGGMLLAKQPFYRAAGDHSPNGRPCRNRCPPCRWWLGEEPVYKWQSSGCGELQGVTDVVILDKLYMKYKTASPVTMIELLSAERRKRWGKPYRKRARV